MRSYQLTGIVLGRTNFNEADRIVRLFTEESGKVSVVAKGVRKIKSRSAGHLEPLGEVKLWLSSGRGSLDVVTSANLQWYPHNLVADYNRLEEAFRLASLIDRLTEPGEAHPKAYTALKTLLQELEAAPAAPLLILWYWLQLLDALGYRPELGQCLLCGYDQPDRGFKFDAVRGGIVCASCAQPGTPDISIPAIKLWRLMSDHPYRSIQALADAPGLAADSLSLAEAFLKYHAIG